MDAPLALPPLVFVLRSGPMSAPRGSTRRRKLCPPLPWGLGPKGPDADGRGFPPGTAADGAGHGRDPGYAVRCAEGGGNGGNGGGPWARAGLSV